MFLKGAMVLVFSAGMIIYLSKKVKTNKIIYVDLHYNKCIFMRDIMKNDDPYKESMRYIDNAKDTLKLAGKDGKFYLDEKYVHTACDTAYIGMLKALDFLFDIKRVPKRKGKKSIEYYETNLSKLDKKLLLHLTNGYDILHRYGYYDGGKSIPTIKDGFDDAISIIEAIKPYSKNGVK